MTNQTPLPANTALYSANCPLILASGSKARQELLKTAGLHFTTVKPGCDEEALKIPLANLPVEEQVLAMARAKAKSVSSRYPDAIIIAADQMCVVDHTILPKPLSLPEAKHQLATLSGKMHAQHTGVCIFQGNQLKWEYHEAAFLTMRLLGESEIDAYLEHDKPLGACGGYYYEKTGKQLFSHLEGTEATILGLPILPLLNRMHELQLISHHRSLSQRQMTTHSMQA